MSAQLSLGEVVTSPPKKKGKRAPKPDVCKCGHFPDDHTSGTGRCSSCKYVVDTLRAEMGPLAKGQAKLCTRFRSKRRVPPVQPLDLLGPAGSFPIWRPDTVHPKAMGWAVIEEIALAEGFEPVWRFYLAQLKTERPNTFMRFGNDPKKARRAAMGMKKRFTDQAEWAAAALEQLSKKEGVEPGDLDMPREVTLTRVSFGARADSDAVVGALKWIRDAVAEALGFDDDRFVVRHDSDAREPPLDRVWLRYEQSDSFKAGVFGVRASVAWRATT